MTTKHNSLINKALSILTALVALTTSSADAQVIWSSPTGSAWLTPANWTGGVVPGAAAVAQFNANPTSATTGVGIHMDTAGGAYATGAISVSSSRTNALIIGNSSPTTPGVLTLNGATVGTNSNVILSNFATSTARLTLQNTQGSGASTMSINAGSGNKSILTGAGTTTGIGNTINITTAITGSAALTFLGGGTWNAAASTGVNGGLLKLGGTNTFTGGITVGATDGTQSGILELDSVTAISNTPANDITINSNSQLYLAAPASSTFNMGNVVLHLNGNGNNYTTTGKGALINLSNTSYVWDGAVYLASDAGIAAAGTSTLTITGNVSGTGMLTKQGTGALVLQGTGNSWTGGTTIRAGRLAVSSGSGLSTAPLAFIQTSGNLVVSLSNTAQTISELSSSVTATSTNSLLINGTRLTINQATNTTFGGNTSTQTSVISGTGAVIKTGSGRLTLTNTGNNFSGGLKISQGEIRFNPASGTTATNSSPDTLDGGTLSTSGIGRTVTFTFGTLALTQNSTIDLGTDTLHSIKFAASSAITWTTGKILTINNWKGSWNGTAGTRGRIYIGTNTTGITATQLSQVRFADTSGYLFNATILSTGEIVPVAPTITTTALSYGPYCNNVDNFISVPFTYTGPFAGPFLVQLSDNLGNFPADFTSNIIGSGSTSPITATIPSGTSSGTQYRIRVVNTSPVGTFGTNNGSNIIVTGVPVLTPISGAAIVATGLTTTWMSSPAGGTWSSANSFIASVNSSGMITGIIPGTTTISYTYTNFCGISASVSDTITVANVPVITAVTPNTATPGSNIVLTGNYLNPSASGSVVLFGNVQGTVTAASVSSLTVTVPAGAQYDRISVTNTATGFTAWSPEAFLPTYTNTGLMTDSINFKPAVNFTTGALPIGVYTGDLDGDGRADMVVTNSGPNSMYVYRNTGSTGTVSSATFASPVVYATGLGPHYVKMADLNADGKPEIIVANTSATSSSISVYRNTSTAGSLSFAGRVDYSIGGTPIDLGVADFDLDGRPDIAVVSQSTNSVKILRNLSADGSINSSSFGTQLSLTTGTVPYKIHVGDLDNDNKADIAVTNYSSNSISVYHNASGIASMAFSSAITISTGTAPTGIAGGDIDGDGTADLVATNTGSQNISVIRNTNTVSGALSFAAGITFTTNLIPEDAVLADVNGDGKTDIAVGNYNAANVSVFRNTATPGSITAASLAPKVDIPTGTYPAGMAWTDIDNDNKPDLVVVSGNSSYVSVIKNYPLPPVGTLSGNDSACAGSPVTITASVPGGYWQSTNTAVATVSNTGVVYPITAGVDTILYYTVAQGDTNFASHVVTTGALVSVGAITAGTANICAGASTQFTNTVSGGNWSSSNAAVATVDNTGFVTGVAAGNARISYTYTSFCGISYDTLTIHVAPGTGYVIGQISGPNAVCAGSAVALTDTAAGGTWSVSNVELATVNSAGSVQGLAQGLATVTYAINTVCGVYQAVHAVNIDTLPDASILIGPANLCAGIPVTYTTAAGAGGVWSTAIGNATIAAATGIATGITPGLDTIRYNITNACGSASGSKDVVITAQPDAGTLIGPLSVCKLDTILLTATIPGGTWSASNGFATSLGNGRIRGVAQGADTIRYTIGNSCGIDTASLVISVVAFPSAGAITSATITLCMGSIYTFTDTTSGGIWSSSNSNTTVSGGIVTPVAAGTDTIKYTVTNACGTATAIRKITIYDITTVDTIAGPSAVCTGAKITLTNATAGGLWTKTNNNVSLTASGVVTGVSAGVDTVIYTPAGNCPMIATKEITVFKSPFTGTITGASAVCVGDTIILRDTVAGGTWSNTNGSTAVADSFVTGITPGVDTVKYTIATAQCGTTSAIKKITVNPQPYAKQITGTSVLAVGATVQLQDSTSGGTWSIKGANALITSSGKLGGLVEGQDTVKYTVTNSCGSYSVIYPITIVPAGTSGSITAIELYPNPTSGSFTLRLVSTSDKAAYVLIAGADFKLISLSEVNTNKDTAFDMDLPDGVYFLSVLGDKGWFTTRFVVVK